MPVLNDNKTNFFRLLAFWVQEWSNSRYFTLTPQTSSALINTLRLQAMLIDELLNDGYDYILTARLQSDPIERRFSQYRQMSGGRFLVSLREVRNTERILSCRSLIKNDINFWKEDLQQPESNEDESYEMIDEMLRDRIEEISESVLDDDSSEVATTISGYIAKKLLKRSKCKDCEKKLTVHDQGLQNDQYLTLLSREVCLYHKRNLQNSCAAVLRLWILLKVISCLLAKSLDLQCIF